MTLQVSTYWRRYGTARFARIGYTQRKRDANVISNPGLRSFKKQLLSKYYPVHRRSSYLRSIEDRRYFYPERFSEPARSTSSQNHRLKVYVPPAPASQWIGKPTYSYAAPPVRVGFMNPSRVMVCVRRAQRKEVLFALGRSGRNGQKRHRMSDYSDVHC